MSKTFFSADFHFGHGNIIKYCKRPFLAKSDEIALEALGCWRNGSWTNGDSSRHRMSAEAVHLMDSTLLSNINELVGEEDELWFLGDFCFAPKHLYYQTARNYRDKIQCKRVNLVMGNHDHNSIRGLFNQVYDQVLITAGHQRIMLNHYAMATWDGSHRNVWQLYGHSHAAIESWMDAIMPGRLSTDVGVDNAARLFGKFRPFGMDDLHNCFKDKIGHKR